MPSLLGLVKTVHVAVSATALIVTKICSMVFLNDPSSFLVTNAAVRELAWVRLCRDRGLPMVASRRSIQSALDLKL